jgi:hypothetical protein
MISLIWYGSLALQTFKMAGHKSSQQQIEHLLFGSVSEEELKPLLDRLRGLCDFATTGGVPFMDREIAYKIGMLPNLSWGASHF